MANKRVHQSVLADLGGGPGPHPLVPRRPPQRRGQDDGGGYEVRLPDPPDGHLLDDRGAPAPDHLYDPDGRLLLMIMPL